MSSSQIQVSGEPSAAEIPENDEDDEGGVASTPFRADNLDTALEGEEEDENELMDDEDFSMNSENVFFCPQNESYSNRSDSQKNIGKSSGERSSLKFIPVACECCGKILENAILLEQHMRTHLNSGEAKCPYCNKTFTDFTQFQVHLSVHGVNRFYECPICRQKFSRPDSVKIHMRIHDKTQCVTCEVCMKTFLTSTALNIHMRIHRGEKPFKCHICGKCFTQKIHVISHIRRHANISDSPVAKPLGPRMFKCKSCPKSFIRVSDFERHMQWTHGAGEKDVVNNMSSFAYDIDEDDMSDMHYQKSKPKFSRKVLCSTGTQTDMEGDHIIVPTKYKKSCPTPTHVGSATPNARADDMYDMFDEGMDRDFSSDEEEADGRKIMQNSGTDAKSNVKFSNSSTTNNDAFDAIIGKTTKSSEGKENITKLQQPFNGSVDKQKDSNKEDASKSVATNERKKCTIPETYRVYKALCGGKLNTKTPKDVDTNTSFNSLLKSQLDKVTVKSPGIMNHFNTTNWKRVGQPRKRKGSRDASKIKPKDIIGLTSATHLSLIRRSLKTIVKEIPESSRNETNSNSIPTETHASKDSATEQISNKELEKDKKVSNKGSEKGDNIKETLNEVPNADSISDPKTTTDANCETNTPDKRIRRQGKTKQHEKDFVCTSKSCDLCNKSVKKLKVDSQTIDEPQLDDNSRAEVCEVISSTEEILIDKTNHTDSADINNTEAVVKTVENTKLMDESQMLLKFLVSGNEPALEETDYKLLNEVTEIKGKNLIVKAEHSSLNDVVHPSTNWHYSVPTYSCKICFKEFRFEGKLHRHIEAAHQNKEIFSEDVKPGRGPIFRREKSELFREFNTEPVYTYKTEHRIVTKPKQKTELDVLRSEWDDEDDNDEEVDSNSKNDSAGNEAANSNEISYTIVKQQPMYYPKDISTHYLHEKNLNTCNYVDTVKVNFQRPLSINKSENSPSFSKNSDSTLDATCIKLLKKLFKSELLSECGLYKEHISVVLGKILRHYGVKMIEDYGQGQYEVLKYNLWRLIEWKVTMEQMEEFYSEGKSVEQMMEDIIAGVVPVLSHEPITETEISNGSKNIDSNNADSNSMSEATQNQLLSQVANVLSDQLTLGEGITQVVLAKDVSPEMLKGAQIVTIDPSTGQIISQVSADQLILAPDVSTSVNANKSALESSTSSNNVTTAIQNMPVIVSSSLNANQASSSNANVKNEPSNSK